jgi:hypothetical protein
MSFGDMKCVVGGLLVTNFNQVWEKGEGWGSKSCSKNIDSYAVGRKKKYPLCPKLGIIQFLLVKKIFKYLKLPKKKCQNIPKWYQIILSRFHYFK